jgi:hypothetical protein
LRSGLAWAGVGVPISKGIPARGRVNGKAVARKGMIDKLRLKLLNWWNELLFLWLIMVGTRLFGCVAISRGEDGNPRAIHFAINQRELNISIRNFVERLDRSYLKPR